MRAFAYVNHWNPEAQYGYLRIEAAYDDRDAEATAPHVGKPVRFVARHLPEGWMTLPEEGRYVLDAELRRDVGWNREFSRFWMAEVDFDVTQAQQVLVRRVMPVNGFCVGCDHMRALVLPQRYEPKGCGIHEHGWGYCELCAPTAKEGNVAIWERMNCVSAKFTKRKNAGDRAEAVAAALFRRFGCIVVDFGAEHVSLPLLQGAGYTESTSAELFRAMPDLAVCFPSRLFWFVEVKSGIPQHRHVQSLRQHWPLAALLVVNTRAREILACCAGDLPAVTGNDPLAAEPLPRALFKPASDFFNFDPLRYEQAVRQVFARLGPI